MTDENIVLGDEIEPDESRTPQEFARDEMLTIEQAAIRVGCPAARIREWISSGQLQTQSEGSIQRISRRELDRLGNPDDKAAQAFERKN